MKRKEYRDRQSVLINVERARWSDFIDICDRERKSASLKISEMIEEELQKNAFGEINPLRVKYGSGQNKSLQSDIRDWLPRDRAISLAIKTRLDANESNHLAETFRIIAQKIKTGYLFK